MCIYTGISALTPISHILCAPKHADTHSAPQVVHVAHLYLNPNEAHCRIWDTRRHSSGIFMPSPIITHVVSFVAKEIAWERNACIADVASCGTLMSLTWPYNDKLFTFKIMKSILLRLRSLSMKNARCVQAIRQLSALVVCMAPYVLLKSLEPNPNVCKTACWMLQIWTDQGACNTLGLARALTVTC